MKVREISLLPDMALFVAVGKAKSFSRAAKTLRIPISTISRRISELEKRVSVQLLRRTARSLELTEAGELYLRECSSIVEAAEMAHEKLADARANPRGHLRVSATPTFASTLLTPVFADFATRYPEVTFEGDFSAREVDIVTENVDVAIRLGDLSDSSVIATKLGRAGFGFFASPRYLERHRPIRVPSDLAHQECILMQTKDLRTTWALCTEETTAPVRVPVSGRFNVNNMRIAMDLAILGMGVAALGLVMTRKDVAAGTLVRVLEPYGLPPKVIHAITPTRLLPAKTKLFLQCLREHIRGSF